MFAVGLKWERNLANLKVERAGSLYVLPLVYASDSTVLLAYMLILSVF